MNFEQWARQWAGQMAKMPHWTKRPGTPVTIGVAGLIAEMSPQEFRVLAAVMTDDEVRGLLLYVKLGAIEAELVPLISAIDSGV